MELQDFGGAFIGATPHQGADGKTRSAYGGYLSWFIPKNPRPVSVTFIHGGGGQSTDFITTPDGRRGWVHAFLAAGYAVYLLDRPGHGRAAWNSDALGPALASPDYAMMQARFMHPSRAPLWPEAHLHTQWPARGDDCFMASQGGMANSLIAAQSHAEAIASALFVRTGPTVLISHSAGGPCGWAIGAFGGDDLRAIIAVEPQGAPDMVHPLGTFAYGLCAGPLAGPHDPFEKPIAVVTAEASWMRADNALIVDWLRARQSDVCHLKLEEHGLYGNGHMMMLEKNSDAIAGLLLDWLAAKV